METASFNYVNFIADLLISIFSRHAFVAKKGSCAYITVA